MVTPAEIIPSLSQSFEIAAPDTAPASEQTPIPSPEVPPPSTSSATALPSELPRPDLGSPANDYLRQRAALADRYEAERQEQALEAEVIERARSIKQQAELRGVDAETADWFAQQYYDQAKSVAQQRQHFERQQAILQGKMMASQDIGREFGVDPQALLAANSVTEMRHIAQREKRYLDQEVRLKKVEQGQVQSGIKYDSGVATSKAGGEAVTRDNADVLWLQGKITDAHYRQIIGM